MAEKYNHNTYIAFKWGYSCLYVDNKYKCESFAVHYTTLPLNQTPFKKIDSSDFFKVTKYKFKRF